MCQIQYRWLWILLAVFGGLFFSEKHMESFMWDTKVSFCHLKMGYTFNCWPLLSLIFFLSSKADELSWWGEMFLPCKTCKRWSIRQKEDYTSARETLCRALNAWVVCFHSWSFWRLANECVIAKKSFLMFSCAGHRQCLAPCLEQREN